jgi:hypothetical protein
LHKIDSELVSVIYCSVLHIGQKTKISEAYCLRWIRFCHLGWGYWNKKTICNEENDLSNPRSKIDVLCRGKSNEIAITLPSCYIILRHPRNKTERIPLSIYTDGIRLKNSLWFIGWNLEKRYNKVELIPNIKDIKRYSSWFTGNACSWDYAPRC